MIHRHYHPWALILHSCRLISFGVIALNMSGSKAWFFGNWLLASDTYISTTWKVRWLYCDPLLCFLGNLAFCQPSIKFCIYGRNEKHFWTLKTDNLHDFVQTTACELWTKQLLRSSHTFPFERNHRQVEVQWFMGSDNW